METINKLNRTKEIFKENREKISEEVLAAAANRVKQTEDFAAACLRTASEMYHANVVMRERAEAFDILACVCLQGRPECFLVTV